MAEEAPSILIVDRERLSTLIAKMLSSKFATDTEVEGIQTIKKLRLEMSNIDESVMDRFTLGDRGIGILKEAAEKDLANADSLIQGLS
ncbi:MAG: hypothetical protein CME25_05725 [Gemmatimonadetes bacterium]|nr:hypothetical protein [Gemmatimonadota bacterium]|tara:strand:+ start:397 stop:660 length:264 start_codon:yes stop_codon:yes gene_type:complete